MVWPSILRLEPRSFFAFRLSFYVLSFAGLWLLMEVTSWIAPPHVTVSVVFIAPGLLALGLVSVERLRKLCLSPHRAHWYHPFLIGYLGVAFLLSSLWFLAVGHRLVAASVDRASAGGSSSSQ